MSSTHVWCALTSLTLTAGFALCQSVSPLSPAESHAGETNVSNPTLPRPELPLSFELNQGQASPEIKALSRGKGYGLLLTSTESVLILAPGDKKKETILKVKTLGSNPAPHVTGLESLPGTVNYFTGSDRAKWRTGIATYGKVKYENVYAGIDLMYYGNQGTLEYDFVVAPGADPDNIRLGISGARKLRIDSEGNLVMDARNGSVIHHKPVIYQDIDGRRQQVAGHFVLRGQNEVAFAVPQYDRRHTLVIDPSLGFYTYFGGTGTDQAKAIAVTSPSGITFVAGYTTSTTLPNLSGAPYGGGATDGFITAYGPNATSVLMTIFLGGSGTDVINGMAIDPTLIVPTFLVVGGITNSPNFPLSATPAQGPGGSFDGFVTKFNIALVGGVPSVTLAFSTYLGGGNVDLVNGVAVSGTAAGSTVFAAGATVSVNFPTKNAQQPVKGGGYDAFLTKYDSTGAVVYSTFFGAAASEMGTAVAVRTQTSPTPAALPYVTGTTQYPGGQRSIVLSYNDAGSALTYVKVLGGATAITSATGIAVDNSSNAYITGTTNDPAFSLMAPVQANFGGVEDAFVVKLDPAGNTVLSTYLGGAGIDRAYAIAVDTFTSPANPPNHIFITGMTTGAFPVTAVQTIFGGGGADSFVAGLKGGGPPATPYSVGYATYLGGAGQEIGYAIAVGSAGHARVAGITNSPGLATPGVAGPTIAGGFDVYVARIQTTPW